MPRRGNIAALRTSRDVSSMISARHHLDQGITFFSLTKFTFFGQFRSFFAKWGLFFAKWGLLFASLYVRKSPAVLLNLGDPIAPLHHCRFCQPNLKLLPLSLRSWNATHDRYLPQCAAEVHHPHQRLFELMTGGAATAGTGGRHVSHGIESQRVTNSRPK